MSPPFHRRTRAILTTVLFALAWSVAIAFGTRTLIRYENTPGRIGVVPQVWPARSSLQRALDRPTLVMLAHPRCPCTNTSVDELAKTLAQVHEKARVYVLFLTPQRSRDWEETSLRRRAAAIPGVTVLSDTDGVEVRLFGAETSGHALLFDAAGRLLFSGGITSSRGHAGDNAGESAIVSLINGGNAARSTAFVFGCSLTGHLEKGNQPHACRR